MKARALAQRALCVAAVLFVSLGVVQAGTIHVNNDGGADYHTIQAALAAARSGDTIILEPGTYAGTGARDIVLAGKVVTIQSSDPNNANVVATTVIDCQAQDEKAHRFIEITPDTGAELTLSGLTVINSAGAFAGGVVLCESASLRVINCSFFNNDAQWWGGAIDCEDSYAVITGCTFTGNVSTAMHGGAIFCRNSVLNLEDCTFRKNTGNAVKIFDSAVTMVDCTFENNVGREGGAIYAYTTLDSEASAYVNMAGCAFTGNIADTTGGALHNYGVEIMIAACTFTANMAGENGGALYNHRSSPSVTDCIFAGNIAVGLGGAIANYNESHPEIVNITFVDNAAASGGAVSSQRDSHPLISHSILWGNQADQGTSLYVVREGLATAYTSKATIEYSDVQGGPSSAQADPGCLLTWGPGNRDVVPLFTGQPFDDYHLSADSPCIDAGDPDYLPGAAATDLEGHARRFGKAVDMGAYEYQGLGPVYRFWSASQSRHFYTISGSERDRLIDRFAYAWQFEGIAYYAFYQNTEDNLVPVYRFWSPKSGSHVWTVSESEKDRLLAEPPDMWTYEGVAFYAYAVGKPPLGTAPVYRFWSPKLGYHFYTMVESEKDRLIREYPQVWTYQGIAFYAYPTPYPSQQVTYDFIGGADGAWYTMTLTAYIDGKEAQIDAPEVRFTTISAWMQMTTDFTNLTTTLDEFHVESQVVEHFATIRQAGSEGLSIPFSMSAQAVFEALSPRGPFILDPATGAFADFLDAGESLTAERETYAYSGSVTLGDRITDFDRTTEAVQLDLESSGTFESLNLLSEAVSASMPLTFQWRRPNVQDLLVETMVDGHLVQIFVTYTYVGTQGEWEGQAVD